MLDFPYSTSKSKIHLRGLFTPYMGRHIQSEKLDGLIPIEFSDRVKMNSETSIQSKLFWCSIIFTIVFLVLSSVAMYSITQLISNSLSGPRLITLEGCPTITGLMIHAVMFAVIIYYLLRYMYENFIITSVSTTSC
jgi:hypothetical protein